MATETQKKEEAKKLMVSIKNDFSNINTLMESDRFARSIKKEQPTVNKPAVEKGKETDPQLATQYSNEIDEYVKSLGVDPKKKASLASKINTLDIVAIVTPLIATFISAYAYILTQQVLTFLVGILGSIPPFLVKRTKAEVDSFNSCSDLCLQFLTLKGKINRLAILGELQTNRAEIDTSLADLEKKARDLGIIIQTAAPAP
jgi:hypothetical protein